MDTANINAAAIWKKVLTLIQRGDFSEAELLCYQLLKIDGQNPYAIHLIGTISLSIGNFQSAVEWINKAISIKPDEASFYSN